MRGRAGPTQGAAANHFDRAAGIAFPSDQVIVACPIVAMLKNTHPYTADRCRNGFHFFSYFLTTRLLLALIVHVTERVCSLCINLLSYKFLTCGSNNRQKSGTALYQQAWRYVVGPRQFSIQDWSG